jgi:hypothetical protein
MSYEWVGRLSSHDGFVTLLVAILYIVGVVWCGGD